MHVMYVIMRADRLGQVHGDIALGMSRVLTKTSKHVMGMLNRIDDMTYKRADELL